MKDNNRPKIYIYVEGGVIQEVITSRSMDVLILDGDVEGSDDYQTFKNISGDKFEAHVINNQYMIDKETVKHYLKQVRKKNESKTNLQNN